MDTTITGLLRMAADGPTVADETNGTHVHVRCTHGQEAVLADAVERRVNLTGTTTVDNDGVRWLTPTEIDLPGRATRGTRGGTAHRLWNAVTRALRPNTATLNPAG